MEEEGRDGEGLFDGVKGLLTVDGPLEGFRFSLQGVEQMIHVESGLGNETSVVSYHA